MSGVSMEHQEQLLRKGSLVEVCTGEEGFKGVWFEATIVEPPIASPTSNNNKGRKKNKVCVEYADLLSDEDGKKALREVVSPECIRPRPPHPDFNPNLELNDIVDAYYLDGWWTGVVTKILDSSRYTVTFSDPPDELDFPLSHLRLHQQWLNGLWIRPDKQESSVSSAQKKEGSPTKLPVKDPRPCAEGSEFIPPSGAKRQGTSYAKECSHPKRDHKDLSSPVTDGIKKKRGRPPKTPVSSQAYRGMETLGKVSNEKTQDATMKSDEHNLKSGKRKLFEVNTESQISGAADTSDAGEGEIIATVPITNFEDLPLSKWIEKNRLSATDFDGSSRVSDVEQHNETRDKSKEIIVRNPATGNEVTMLSHLPSLPFVKNTQLWDTIESMDVFQNIPQKPHFRPLQHSKESCREGLAIGHMVTFSSVVNKVSTLDFEEPRSTIGEMLDTLCELECHGFDVQPVRDRLNEMLSLKDKHENLAGLLTNTHSEMEKIDEEVVELKKQLAELEKKLSESVSKKEAKTAHIASLRSRADEISNEIRNFPGDFEALTCKPIVTL